MSRRSARSLVPRVLASTALVLAVIAPLVAQSPPSTPGDPRVLGTWLLDLTKSKFMPGPPPTSQTRTYEAHDNGYRATIRTTYATRKPTFIEYTANYDSLEYPVAGSPDYDSIRLKKLDDSTSEATLGHGGNVYATTRRVMSRDGQTMTITVRADEQQGARINNVMVFTKQK